MQNLTITGLVYVPSTPATLKQGVKGNQVPKGAFRGSNGSFLISGDPPKVILCYELDDSREGRCNIYDVIKTNSNHRVTEKYANKILNELSTMSLTYDDGTLVNLTECICNAITKVG